MRYRQMGKTSLQVSEIGFGVWTVATTWWGIREEPIGLSLLKKAFDLGINFFDTADAYGDGLGETILAKALGGRREEIVIATKAGYDFTRSAGRRGQEELPQDFSPGTLEAALHGSLKRLNTDRIDLYQLHNPRIDVIRRDETFEALARFKKEGKIKAFGVALGPAIAERQAEEGRAAIEERRVDSVQIIYNLLEQMLGEHIFPAARGSGSSVLVRVPHASGLLDGTVGPETTFAPADHRYHRVSTGERKRRWQEEGLKKVERLGFLTDGTGRTLGQAALRFILAEPSVASVFPNITNESLLADFAGASAAADLAPAEFQEVQRLYRCEFCPEK